MVSPADIEYAEKYGMPENEPEIVECAWCKRPCNIDELIKCEFCKKYLCEDCRIDMGEFIKSYSGNWVCDDPDVVCVIKFLVSIIEQDEAYIQKLQAKINEQDAG